MQFHWLLLALLAGLAWRSEAAIYATFDHGVASGDPLPDSVVLWTRVSPRLLVTSSTPLHKWPSFDVEWNIYEDADLTRIVLNGTYNATKEHDWTVKVFPTGLNPNSDYWYNFVITNGSSLSPTGHFRLPPAAGEPLDNLRYFIFSCSNWPAGFFNIYDQASRYDLDFWLHLGDYYYEYGASQGTGDVRWEVPPEGLQPSTDIETLDDYRKRHGLYRTDPGLQALSASAPLIAIWDDHEFMNNIWAGGAQNQYPGQVEFFQRKFNALRAYTEWMPIRWNLSEDHSLNTPAVYAINRTFEFGNLATLFMLEDRATKRTQAGDNTNEFDPTGITSPDAAVEAVVGQLPISEWNSTTEEAILNLQMQYNIKRTNKSDVMFGPEQMAWIRSNTERSAQAGVTWQLYGQGLIMQDQYAPDYEAAAQSGAPNSEVQAYWTELYDNLTSGANATYTSYSTSAANRGSYGKTMNVTDAIREAVRTSVAMGRYTITPNHDSWHGYLWERYYFLGNISGANNPTIYAGDSHNFWTGYLVNANPEDYVLNGSYVPTSPIVATEFDGGSVSSNGYESNAYWPQDLTNTAWEAASPAMVHTEVRYRGGLYVQLTPENQHVEHIYVDTTASMNYRAFCGVAFDVPARVNGTGEIVINAGECTPLQAGAPYGVAGGSIMLGEVGESGLATALLAGTAMPTDAFLVESQ